MTTVRRGFHTLKGSGRMVGLKNFADGAWAVEQCFNVWLAQERPASQDLLELGHRANEQMRQWLRAVPNDPNALIHPHPFISVPRAAREPTTLPPPRHPIP